jgi:hypothetical protein
MIYASGQVIYRRLENVLPATANNLNSLTVKYRWSVWKRC